ncbi:vacuolar membrane protein-domain-containing protein [Xylariaceae sp. FL0255]|nr:vacuolar membrane protein-domain-containing protein [Xylariaceae sp. FL0255]
MPIPFEVSPIATLVDHVSSVAGGYGGDIASQTSTAFVAATTSAILSVVTEIASQDGNGNGNGGGGGGGNPGDDEGECRLLGPFALIVQLALGGLALLSLVYKRSRERPQRPIKIWFFDVSKQVFGSVLVHAANVFMSMLTSGRFSMKLEPRAFNAVARIISSQAAMPYVPNPCSFYLLNLAIDTTIGIPILIILLRIITGLVAYTPLGKPAESIQSGHYGDPPNVWWWLKQSIIYFGGLFGMKLCVLVIFLILPWISRVGDWALKWTEGNERLQIIFVMMLFPLIMNALQYYIIDSFIKEKGSPHQPLSQSDDIDDRDPFDDSDSDDASIVSGESSSSVRLERSLVVDKPSSGKDREEYDPDLDGQTIVGSSQSQEDTRKTLPKELVPGE